MIKKVQSRVIETRSFTSRFTVRPDSSSKSRPKPASTQRRQTPKPKVNKTPEQNPETVIFGSGKSKSKNFSSGIVGKLAKYFELDIVPVGMLIDVLV